MKAHKCPLATLLGLAAGAVMLAVAATPGRAEITPPKVGQTAKYQCTGEYGKQRTFKVVRVEDGLIRREGAIDGKKTFVEEYRNGIGTTLFKTRDRADGSGTRGQRFNEDDFKGYERLEPGSKYSGNVREWTNRGPWWWRYVISVGQPKVINHKVLGEITVVPVTEIRTVKGQRYGSKLEQLIVPELGLELSAIYRDEKGTYTCDLASFEPGG